MPEKRILSAIEDELLLWNNFRAGDKSAYTELMKRYINIMFKYGVRLCADEDLLKDCIQDVFFELWNRRLRINPTASVKAYLLKSLRLRIYREQPKWNYAECLNDIYNFTIEYSIENQLIEEQSLKESHDKLARLLNDMPPRQKEILYLRFYEGFDHLRIADVMGLNRQSVYNLLNDALNTLRKHWQQDLATAILIFISVLK